MALELTIKLLDTGKVEISGHIDNKVVAFGLLEVAKDVIREHHDRTQRLVQPAAVAHFGPIKGS